jgi:uncharacterized protein YqcC (DUF446 family)
LEFVDAACKDNQHERTKGVAVRDVLSDLLKTLEAELRVQGRWAAAPPDHEALNSSQPFAADTLEFDQWLQWILLPRMTLMLEQRLPLPTACAIRAMAEETYGPDDRGGKRITEVLGEIDRLLTAGH